VGQARELARNLERADVVIDAYSFRSRWYEFHKPERFVALGRKAALKRTPALLAATETNAKTIRKS
jgi:putative heme degradation protein